MGRAAEGRPSILLHFVVAAVVVAVVAADGFASLSALAGTASSGLALRLSTSAPCVNAVADDAVVAGPTADADADDSGHLPPGPSLCETMPKLFSIVDFPPSGLYSSPCGRFICF